MRALKLLAGSAALAMCACSSSSSPTPAPSAPTPQAKSITVVGTPPTVGTSSQFTAFAVLVDGSSSTVTSTAVWSSTNTAVATVAAGGMVTAAAQGSTNIVAAYGGASGVLTITVAAPSTADVTGAVSDSVTGGRIAGATVTVSGVANRTTTTDASGTYSIKAIPQGAISISVAASGYITATRSVSLVNVANGVSFQNFLLGPGTVCPALGFDELPGDNSTTITMSSMCGLTLRTTLASWYSSANGRPAPSLQFSSLGTSTQGEVQITAGGKTFKFLSVDVYSSVTPIPYTFTGILGTTTVFTVSNTQGNTFGNFATVTNPQSSSVIDSLVIHLTNSAGTGSNPMGIDNVRVSF